MPPIKVLTPFERLLEFEERYGSEDEIRTERLESLACTSDLKVFPDGTWMTVAYWRERTEAKCTKHNDLLHEFLGYGQGLMAGRAQGEANMIAAFAKKGMKL